MQLHHVDPQPAVSPTREWAVLDFPSRIQDPVWAHDELPEVPALPSTVVHLEFLLQEHAIDLRAVAEVILRDLGASIQVLRISGSLQDAEAGRARKMQDYIVDLGKETLLSAIPAITYARDGRHSLIAASWEYGRLVGQTAQTIAGVLPGVDPEKAYLAGLLHDMGTIPMLLGWSLPGVDVVDFDAVACWLAREWSLPWFVAAPFGREPKSPSAALWVRIVGAAREATQLLNSVQFTDPGFPALARCEAVLQRHFPNMELLVQHRVATKLCEMAPVQGTSLKV